MRYLQVGLVALTAGLGVFGCSGEGGPVSEGSGAPVLSSNGDPKTDKRDVQPPEEEILDDLQIATVLHVVNRGEIREARFAAKRAMRSDVQDFAARMETEHRMADKKLRALFKDTDPPPEALDPSALEDDSDSPRGDRGFPNAPSEISRQLQRQTALDLEQLRGIVPPEFDLGYISKQVAAHAGVYGVIVQKLLPSVEMRELRQFLEETQPTVHMHLQHATDITHSIVADKDDD